MLVPRNGETGVCVCVCEGWGRFVLPLVNHA
eukprot:COSAG06_NODE_47965_length_335_cov_1.122881_1_plen_30_part_10